jgi:hypothetical protein
LVYAKDGSTTSETFIRTSKEDVSNPELTKGTSTHNAWFDCNIEIGTFEDFSIICFEDLINGTEFSMTDSLTINTNH